MIPSLSCLPPVEDKLITSERLELAKYLELSRNPAAGAVVVFSGEVRNHHLGREVSYLEYEAEENMAGQMILKIKHEALTKFGLLYAFCIHRIGAVQIGESAVIVITTHAHRKEAYEANEYIIDRVKHEAPIWKKEYYPDGTYSWGNNCHCEGH